MDEEKAVCKICGKEMERKTRFIFRKEVCSNKCRVIKWALKEANKVMVKK